MHGVVSRKVCGERHLKGSVRVTNVYCAGGPEDSRVDEAIVSISYVDVVVVG